MKTLQNSLLLSLLLVAYVAVAQDNSYPVLAQTFSQTAPKGSARMVALGGSHAALGADITNAGANPAGLGFYRRGEFSFTPSMNLNDNDATYIGNTTNTSKGNLNVSNIGVVFGSSDKYNWSGWRSGTFAVSYSRENTLTNNIDFRGTNNRSSMSDSFAQLANEEARSSNITASAFDDDFNKNGLNFDYPTSMFYYSYLIDPTSNTGPPYNGAEIGKSVQQDFAFRAKGAVNQWNFAYGTSYKDKFYLGISMSTPRFNYETTKTATEAFINPAEINGFSYTQTLNTTGRGLNIGLGMVYRPNDMIRVGASLTTPTWYDVTETTASSLATNVKQIEISASNSQQYQQYLNNLTRVGYAIATSGGKRYITGIPRLNVAPYNSDYQLTTPLKANGGVAVFFGKNGFISGDVEYVNYGGMKLRSDDSGADGDLRNGAYTKDIKAMFKSVVNAKVGAEVRMNGLALRGGISYFADPTRFNDGIDRSRMVYSGGLGYRNDRFFIDTAVLYSTSQSAYAPYTLSNSQDYASARISNSNLNARASVGMFF